MDGEGVADHEAVLEGCRMSFRFTVKDVWGSDSLSVYHLIGILREGRILSGDRAEVPGVPGVEIRIKAMVLTPRASAHSSDITVSIERPQVGLSALIGRELVSLR